MSEYRSQAIKCIYYKEKENRCLHHRLKEENINKVQPRVLSLYHDFP